MPGPVSTTPPFSVQDPGGVRALVVIGPNTRVKGAQGLMGTQVDQLLFVPTGPPFSVIGKWIVPNTRVQIGGARTVGATSQGTAFSFTPPNIINPTGPMVVTTPDTKINNT